MKIEYCAIVAKPSVRVNPLPVAYHALVVCDVRLLSVVTITIVCKVSVTR